jgi:hypothetical protein
MSLVKEMKSELPSTQELDTIKNIRELLLESLGSRLTNLFPYGAMKKVRGVVGFSVIMTFDQFIRVYSFCDHLTRIRKSGKKTESKKNSLPLFRATLICRLNILGKANSHVNNVSSLGGIDTHEEGPVIEPHRSMGIFH